jgi:uncharacterized protein (DUF885 family)
MPAPEDIGKPNRRNVLICGAAGAAALVTPTAARADPEVDLAGLFDTFVEETLRLRPEGATTLGLDKGANADLRGKLADESDAGRAAARALTRSQLARLGKVDRTALSPADRVTYDTVLYTRQSAAAVQAFDFGAAVYNPSPYVVSQQSGAYQSTPALLDTKHPVETDADAEAYLARLAGFAQQLDANSARLRHDAARGVVAPDYLLGKALIQLDELRVTPAEARVVQSLARRAAAHGLSDRYGAAAERLYAEAVLPAIDRQMAAVRTAAAHAPEDAGIWRRRRGDDFYRVALAATTTTRLSPQEVHRFGLERAEALSARLDPLLTRAGLGRSIGGVGARLAALARQPGQVFPDTDIGKAQLIGYCNTRAVAVRRLLPRAFRRLPPYRFSVRRVPMENEAGAPSAFSQAPALDGSRPGFVYLNLHDTTEWPKYALTTVICHEGLPGHQFDSGLSLSNEALPLIRKITGFSGYSEGWALYGEQVADEIGLYEDDPLGQIGYLREALFRAQRCVVDTGLHHFRWSRERAIAHLCEQIGEVRGFAEREVDRYAAAPGQACSYALGHAVFVRLRAAAQAKLGAGFDLRDFHDAVLGCGRVPLGVLERVGTDWIAARA